jgi:hypothetical protein
MENKDFVEYEEALELKQLGYDEPCFDFYDNDKELFYNDGNNDKIHIGNGTDAPTYSQAFRWFRKKYKLGAIVAQFGWGIENELGQIIYDISDGKTPSCYEESELDCLKKLIEIVKG